ncbi:MAG: DegV family protein [Tissierellia bacterium]|nr:DegV family protein [Tissierellia bacterium]
MKTIKIITDSTVGLTRDFVERYDIGIVPLSYTFEGKNYIEGVTQTSEEYYARLAKSKSFPVTSQPPTGDFCEAYTKALKEYEEVLVITLSSKISGTYNSAVLAKEIVSKDNITVIDSMNAVKNIQYQIEDAIDMMKQGKSRREIEEHINSIKGNQKVALVVDDLEYLRRGGRISSFSSSLGNILKVKPIIGLEDGQLVLKEKLRGTKNAMDRLVQMPPEDTKRLSISHVTNPEMAKKLRLRLEQRLPSTRITIDELSPVIGSHIGIKAIGILY